METGESQKGIVHTKYPYHACLFGGLDEPNVVWRPVFFIITSYVLLKLNIEMG